MKDAIRVPGVSPDALNEIPTLWSETPVNISVWDTSPIKEWFPTVQGRKMIGAKVYIQSCAKAITGD